MSLTFNNKLSFKETLKENRGLFLSPLVKAYMGDVEPLFNSGNYPPDTNALTPIKIVPFSYNEIIDVTGSLFGGDYIYLPGSSNDKVTIKNGDSLHTFTFNVNGDLNNFLYDVITIGDKVFRVDALGGGLLQVFNGAIIEISPSSIFVNEGESITFNITAENIDPEINFYYTISGLVSNSDFADNTLSGTVILSDSGNGVLTGSIIKTINLDLLNESNETFILQLRIDSLDGDIVGTSPTITIVDIAPIFSVTPSTSTINEGESVTFNVNAENIPSGTTLYYDLFGTNVNINDFSDKLLSGSFVVSGIGTSILTGSVTKTLVIDADVESDEEFVFRLRTGSIVGPIVSTSSPVKVIDVPFTLSVGLSTTIITESTINSPTILTVDVEAIGVPDGTVLNYAVNSVFGNVNTQDITPLFSSFSISNERGSFNLEILRDGRTEGPEIFNVRILNSNGIVVATSANITILDTSFIGSNKTGKTFGPIKVNRDSGNTDRITDWYTLCGLDKLPDGSKISLFIDTSGSMTLSTVQASYDQLLQRLSERNMDVIIVTNSSEDWITPFDVELND